MAAVKWQFEALDTYFFRGARPFNAGEGGPGGQNSFFPPVMPTLQGAIRYLLAINKGWQPGDESLPAELGDHSHLGELKLSGPYLYYGETLLLPAPLHLLYLQDKSKNKKDYHRLIPGDSVLCDLGHIRLPVMPDGIGGAKPMDNYWLTAMAMEKVLAGGVPQDNKPNSEQVGSIPADGVIGSEKLWKIEPKVGISRERDTRVAKDKNLYLINMIRPMKKVSVVVGVDGISREWSQDENLTNTVSNLGGESRLAKLSVSAEPLILPRMPKLTAINGKVRFTVTLITPGYFGDQQQTKKVIMNLKPWINHACVTACIGKSKKIGGWDLSKGRQCPRPLRPFIPAGSTWFFEGDEIAVEEIE